MRPFAQNQVPASLGALKRVAARASTAEGRTRPAADTSAQAAPTARAASSKRRVEGAVDAAVGLLMAHRPA
jgi:hypothetical protein